MLELPQNQQHHSQLAQLGEISLLLYCSKGQLMLQPSSVKRDEWPKFTWEPTSTPGAGAAGSTTGSAALLQRRLVGDRLRAERWSHPKPPRGAGSRGHATGCLVLLAHCHWGLIAVSLTHRHFRHQDRWWSCTGYTIATNNSVSARRPRLRPRPRAERTSFFFGG